MPTRGCQGNVIGQLDLSTMRVLAPDRRVDEAVEKGEQIFMRRDGIISPLLP